MLDQTAQWNSLLHLLIIHNRVFLADIVVNSPLNVDFDFAVLTNLWVFETSIEMGI